MKKLNDSAVIWMVLLFFLWLYFYFYMEDMETAFGCYLVFMVCLVIGIATFNYK